jgi:nitroreductase
MANSGLSHTSGIGSTPQNLTPEEKAVLDGARAGLLRDLFSLIWGMKLRLQFTGWLQYIPSGVTALALFLVAAIAALLGNRQVADAFTIIGSFPLAVFTLDLVTVKFRLRFHERLPQRKLLDYVRVHSAAPKIGEAPIRFEYVSAPLSVWPTVNANEFLVAIAPSEYNRLAVIDVGRSLQKIVMDATRMGLGTCWIGPGAKQASVARHLGDRFNPKKDHVICVCAIGYKSWYIPMFLRIFNLQFHRRLPLSSLFFADSHFDRPLDVEAYPFNRFGRNYEICEWAPSSYNGQTTRCVAVMEQNRMGEPARIEDRSRLARFDFYAVTDSRYYAAVALGIWCANWELGCEALGLQGHLAVLSADERDLHTQMTFPQLPRYDVSWVVDEKL